MNETTAIKRHKELTKYIDILKELGNEVYIISSVSCEPYDRVTVCCKTNKPRKSFWNYEVYVYDDHVRVLDIYRTMYRQTLGDVEPVKMIRLEVEE